METLLHKDLAILAPSVLLVPDPFICEARVHGVLRHPIRSPSSARRCNVETPLIWNRSDLVSIQINHEAAM